MSIGDELALVGLDVDRVRGEEVDAIIPSSGDQHTFLRVSIKEERPEGALGYRVVLNNPGIFTEEKYVSIGNNELRIVHNDRLRQYVRTDYVIPQVISQDMFPFFR